MHLLKLWVEFQQFGWNAATVGFLGTIVFTVLSAVSFIDQAHAIWKKRSAEALAPAWKISYTGLMGTAIVYGISELKYALVFHGLIMVLAQIPILWGMIQFQTISHSQKTIGCGWLLAIVLIVALPSKPQLYFTYSILMLPPLLTQPWEFWKRKTVGVVRVQMLWVYWIATAFWVTYAFAVQDWPLRIIGTVNIVCFTGMIALWYRYRPNATP